MFSNWKLIHKTKTSMDDMTKPKPKDINKEYDNMVLRLSDDYQKNGFIQSIEIDGTVYVSQTKNGCVDYGI